MTHPRRASLCLNRAGYWWLVVRIVGSLPALAAAIAVAAGLALAGTVETAGGTSLPIEQVTAIVVSLAAALHTAFASSPSDEPCIELLLSYARPMRLILRQRLAVVASMHATVAVAGTLAAQFMGMGKGLLTEVASWLAPSILLAGTALLVTLVTRQAAFGGLLTTMMWVVFIAGGDALVARWPVLYPLHLFLLPGQTPLAAYALNRCILITGGLAMIARARRLAEAEERMLGVVGAARWGRGLRS
jgi:hypothetical protein